MNGTIIKLPNPRSDIQWTGYLATAYSEGFCEGENATAEEALEAWACLIKTNLCSQLQGWFGRTAQNMLDFGLITKDGTINWELAEQQLV